MMLTAVLNCMFFFIFIIFVLYIVGDLDRVVYELKCANFPSHKWSQLAVSLKAASAVDNIEDACRMSNSESKLIALIRHWISNSDDPHKCKWATLIEAVDMCAESVAARVLEKAVGELRQG